MQLGLVSEKPHRQDLTRGSWVEFARAWLPTADCVRLLEASGNWPWAQYHLQVPGRDEPIPMPRLECVFGEEGKVYRYSGNTYNAHPWRPELAELRDRVSARAGVSFNVVFANLYRTNRDSIGYHSDDDPHLGPVYPDDVRIASVSLGGTRAFTMRPMDGDRPAPPWPAWNLASGDLLIMGGRTQRDWVHRVPKANEPCAARVNLTFRVLT